MSLKSRIEALILQISNAKTSLGDALRNKGVDPGPQPSFEALRSGIEGIPSGDTYKELIGQGSIFSTKLDTNKTARRMVMAPDKSSVSVKINARLDSVQSTLDKINGSFNKGDLVAIVTYAMPIDGNFGLCIYNLSEDSSSYFSGFGNSTGMQNGYPWVERVLFLESVDLIAVSTGRYKFSFTGWYALKIQSPVD